MKAWAPSPGPIAVFLLGLEERGADGSVDFGGRRLVIRRGKVVDVVRAPSDVSLLEFLRATRRIDESRAQHLRATLEDPDRILDGGPGLTAESLHDAVRAVWLDRLVRALEEADASGESVPTLRPAPSRPAVVEVSLLSLVLDALERRAAEADAEEVGQRTTHRIDWVDSPLASRARKWAELGSAAEGRDARVGQVLSANPSAPSRIAALLRAGLLRLSAPRGSVPAPAPRLSMPPPIEVAERASIAPARPAEVRLGPGSARAFDDEIVAPPLPSFPAQGAKLVDPLEPLEQRIAMLEQKNAAPLDRAAEWRILGDALRVRCGSLEEQVRCYREAVAATPSDTELLFATADACAASRQVDLALAYGRAGIASRTDSESRRKALLRYAKLARRTGRPTDALAASRAAASLGEGDSEPLVLSGQLEADAGLFREAIADWVDAALAERPRDPAASHAWITSAYLLDPTAERAADAFAASLSELGLADAALAVRARSAALLADPDQRRRALLSTAEKAEMAGRPSLAADLLLTAFAEEPHVDLLYEPLDVDLETAGRALERAIVLSEIARACGDELSEEWGLRAARAWLALGDDEARSVGQEQLARMAETGSGRALSELGRLAERGDLDAFDALELVARRASTNETKRAALAEITRFAGARQPGRLAWAMHQRDLSPPAGLLDEVKADHAKLRAALSEIGRATGPVPAASIVEVFNIARRDPAVRKQTIEGLERIAQRDARASEAVARLFALEADGPSEQRALLRAAAGGEPSGRAARKLARAATSAGDPARALEAWQRAVDVDEASEEARLRLVTAAKATGDAASVRAALDRRLALAAEGAERARAALELAEAIRSTDRARAAELAERALVADSGDARAALVLLELIDARDPSPSTISRLRSLAGETCEGLSALARVATEASDCLAATVRWAALAPASPAPLVMALSQSLARGIDDYLEVGVVALLESDRATPAVEPVLVRALERLASLDRAERAGELCARAAAHLGPGGPRLSALAVDIAQRTGSPRLLRDALELGLPPPGSPREERAAQLRRIADLHRRGKDRPSEARALLRLLAVAPRDPSALDRLSAIHAESGDHDRLLATLAMRTDEGATPVERVIGLLSLAKAHFEVIGDPAQGEDFLAAAVEPPEGEESEPARVERLVTAALGMVSLGRAQHAIDMLVEQSAADTAGNHRLVERAVEIALREQRDPVAALAIIEEELGRRQTLRGRLLLMFEQLALDRRDAQLAERIYGQLIDGVMGTSGRRALRYRRARWLERAGASREALAAYVDACTQASSTGAIATSLERLARELGDLDAFAKGLTHLANAAPHPVLKGRLIRRAARVYLEEMARPERAFDALFAEWKDSFSVELEDDLARSAKDTEEVDPARGAAAFDAIFEVLRKRADDAWTGEEKARLLRKLARVHHARGDLASAEAVAREAIAAQRADDPDEMALAKGLVELAGWIARDQPAAARVLVDEAVKLDGTNEDAKRLAAQLPEVAGEGESESEGESEGEGAGESESESESEGEGEGEGEGALASAVAPAIESPPRPAQQPAAAARPYSSRPPASRAPLFELADDGDDPDAPEPQRVSLLDLYRPMSAPPAPLGGRGPIALPEPELAAVVDANALVEKAARASRALESETACALLRAAILADPGHLEALTRLAREAEASGRDLERALALGALSVSTNGKPPPLWEVSPSAARGPLATALGNPAHAGVLAVLKAIWESAQPLFRVPLAQLGVVGTDRVGVHGPSPVARALLASTELFGWEDPQLFVAKRPARAELARAQPPALVLGLDVPRDERELRFVVARGLVLTRPENILVASLLPADGQTLFAAIRAAFGPADGSRVAREAAVMASELWRLLPPGRQRDVRELLSNSWDALDYDAVRASVLGGAARAGLLVAGDVGAALRGLLSLETPPIVVRDVQSLSSIAREHGAAMDLLRFAFGDALVETARLSR